TLQTSDGAALDISPLQVPAQVRGRPAILGMRPEHMLLNAQGLKAEVEMVETLGSEQLVHCRCGQSAVVTPGSSRQPAAMPASPGDRISIAPDGPHPLHWFEPDAGRRVQRTCAPPGSRPTHLWRLAGRDFYRHPRHARLPRGNAPQ